MRGKTYFIFDSGKRVNVKLLGPCRFVDDEGGQLEEVQSAEGNRYYVVPEEIYSD